jgi:hypothetical protein
VEVNKPTVNREGIKMMPEQSNVELKILSTLLVKDTMMIVGKLVLGDIYGRDESLTCFICTETGGRWELVAMGFPTEKEWKDNLRSIGVEHVEGSKELELGYTLVSE